MISAENLSKNYGEVQALKDISFEIGKGEIVGFLGPNGAGKSSTMNILTGFLSLSQGTVKIGGYDILEQPLEARSLIGYLPETLPLHHELTVSEYLSYLYGLKKLEAKGKQQEVQRVAELCGIASHLQRRIGNLSKGYKQRVGLAQALLGSPPVLILDEPTVGLDPQQVLEIRQLIQELRHKHTIILSSHILSEVEIICQRILILHHGQLVADDSAESLSRHLHQQEQELHCELLLPAGREDALAECLEQLGIKNFTFVLASPEEAQNLKLAGAALAKQLMEQQQVPLEDPWQRLELRAQVRGEQPDVLALQLELGLALNNRGIFITGCQRKKPSLEDIFISFTHKSADSEATKEAEQAPEGDSK